MATAEHKVLENGAEPPLSTVDTPTEEAGEIEVEGLTLDFDLLGRETLDPATVERYTEFYRAGRNLRPIRVVEDEDDTYWVWDGFHRVTGARKANRKVLPALIRKGTKRDALKLSLGANEDHGLSRTTADRRMAVVKCLDDPEWSSWSLRRIADLCNCSHEFVRSVQHSLFAPAKPTPAPEPDPAPLSTVDSAEPAEEDEPEEELSTVDSPPMPEDLDAETKWLVGLKLTDRLTAQPLLTFWEDAKKYRKLHDSEHFQNFLRVSAQVLAQQNVAVSGPFHDILARLVRLLRDRHPDRWKLCAACSGAGLRPQGQCSQCSGRGYRVEL